MSYAHSATLEDPRAHHDPVFEREQRLEATRPKRVEAKRRELLTAMNTALLDQPLASIQQLTGVKSSIPWSFADQALSDIGGHKTLDAMLELFRIVGMCAKGEISPALHLRAAAWIAARSREFADFYADDLVDQEDGEL